jgi:hypothetical protein
MLFAAASPCLAASQKEREGFETFLSVLDSWGGFLARLTGSYSVLDSITRFADLARNWHDFIDAGGFTPSSVLAFILGLLGFSEDEEQPGGGGIKPAPDGGYSI